MLFGGALDPENHWVLFATLLASDEIEEAYVHRFSPTNGAPAKPARLAFDPLFIKQRLGLSDEETIEQIRKMFICSIRLSGKRLGRPPKEPDINAANKQQLSADQPKWNEVEEMFGSGKRKHSRRLFMTRLAKSEEASISMTFLVMCAEKIRRHLRPFLVFISAWLYAC